MNRIVLMVCTVLTTVGAWAQESETAAAAAKTAGMSLKQAWEYGGWIMWVLGGVSIFALAFVFYFLGALRQGAIVPRTLFTDVLARIRSGEWDSGAGKCFWWLRSPGIVQGSFVCATYEGYLWISDHVNHTKEIFFEDPNYTGYITVRPAMWIELG